MIRVKRFSLCLLKETNLIMNTAIQRKELRTRLYTVESPFNEISFPAFFCLHYNNTFVNTVETVHEGKLLIHRDQRFAQTPILSVQENFETIHLILYIQYIEIMIHVLVCENKGRNLSKLDSPTTGQLPIQILYRRNHSSVVLNESS